LTPKEVSTLATFIEQPAITPVAALAQLDVLDLQNIRMKLADPEEGKGYDAPASTFWSRSTGGSWHCS
jgi:hypothetical protein